MTENPILVFQTDLSDYYLELKTTGKVYFHVGIKKFGKAFMREGIEISSLLQDKYDGLYAYAPCDSTVKLLLAAGYEPTGETVGAHWDESVQMPEFKFGG